MLRGLLFIVLLVYGFNQCTGGTTEPLETHENVKSLLIYNFTGHLVRRSGEKCGSAIQVEFVLTSPEDKQEYIIEGDKLLSVALAAEIGQSINVSAYEVDGVNRTFLTQRTMTFDPPSDRTQEIIPSIVLCPKDQLEFYDFN